MTCRTQIDHGVRPRSATTYAQRDAVIASLEQAASKAGAYCVYRRGWDDERVAREAIPDFAGDRVGVVKRIRRQFFGYLKAS